MLAEAGIAIPRSTVIHPTELETFQPELPPPWVLKAQVLSGGRGKAGGVRLARDLSELRPVAIAVFDAVIKGTRPPYLLLEETASPVREFYLSLALNRSRGAFLLTVGSLGGVDIETAGREHPESILVQEIDPVVGPRPFQITRVCFHLGADKAQAASLRKLIAALWRVTETNGLLLAEINPLALMPDGSWLALDAKIEIDDNRVGLKPELTRFDDPIYSTTEENRAAQAGMSFHKLSGWVGLVANGAGLAMATMDLLNFAGLPAANFLDLGGAADSRRIGEALDILFTDPKVGAVFINVFGGILSCAKVANALKEALANRLPTKPIVTRLAGNGAVEGRDIVAGLTCGNVHPVADLDAAVAILRDLAQTHATTSGPGQSWSQDIPPAPGLALSLAPSFYGLTAPCLLPPLKLDASTPILVQGVTGREGLQHASLMRAYGTNITAGVTPFKGGQTVLDGVPVYDTVAAACRDHAIGASVIFVPAAFAPDAILEAADAGIPWIVCITEGIPQAEMLKVRTELRKYRSGLIGPNTPGVIVPGQTKLGIMPGDAFSPGPVAVLSRSGTLTYESVARLGAAGIGQSVSVGVGGDPFGGVGFVDVLKLLRHDPRTRAVLLLGEIGGMAEEEAAAYVAASGFEKPLVSFIAARTAPPGKRFGHAGAIIEDETVGVTRKLQTLESAGIIVCPDLKLIPDLMRTALAKA